MSGQRCLGAWATLAALEESSTALAGQREGIWLCDRLSFARQAGEYWTDGVTELSHGSGFEMGVPQNSPTQHIKSTRLRCITASSIRLARVGQTTLGEAEELWVQVPFPEQSSLGGFQLTTPSQPATGTASEVFSVLRRHPAAIAYWRYIEFMDRQEGKIGLDRCISSALRLTITITPPGGLTQTV